MYLSNDFTAFACGNFVKSEISILLLSTGFEEEPDKNKNKRKRFAYRIVLCNIQYIVLILRLFFVYFHSFKNNMFYIRTKFNITLYKKNELQMNIFYILL